MDILIYSAFILVVFIIVALVAFIIIKQNDHKNPYEAEFHLEVFKIIKIHLKHKDKK